MSSFSELLQNAIENPESVMDKDLSEEELLKLYSKLNPLNNIPAPNSGKSVLMSVMNVSEIYNKRLLMTGLVGYLFKACEEFKSNNMTEFCLNNDTLSVEVESSKPNHIDRIVSNLESILVKAKELQAMFLQQRLDGASGVDKQSKEFNTGLYDLNSMLIANGQSANKTMPEIAKMAGIKFTSNKVKLSPEINRKIVKDFLTQNFDYDPAVHIRPFSDKINYDIYGARTGNPITELVKLKIDAAKPTAEHKEAVDLILANNNNWHTVCYLLDDYDLDAAYMTARANREQFKTYLYTASVETQKALEYIPPADVFISYNMYLNANYDELRRITETIYPERPIFENVIGVWETIEGSDEHINAKYKDYVDNYQANINTDILNVRAGEWTVISPFRKNRLNIDIFNKSNDALKKILDNNTQDQKIAEAMMKKRIMKQKAENIREAGVDSAGLAGYSTTAAAINAEEKLRLEKANGSLKAAHQLSVIDNLSKRITELENKTTPYTDVELAELEQCKKSIIYQKELLLVEDGEVRVDMWENKGGVLNQKNIIVEQDSNFIAKPATGPVDSASP